ncbi:DUF4412 domain-containing protein [Komagataeibacter sp. FNDCR2]|uniref:DUF4412 domain-containing protein n=1 Tax=Komagataeibacter sp. FNDCR2 TaxID=2878682 RepID=UPI001E51DA9B|nr:DUF4412 domain-containing protein [Komagataeibacter sp. FNDCR2]MCE2575082.1 DUF4412 domain-containing protein [Komagataeibacter sp. FNDCR2]
MKHATARPGHRRTGKGRGPLGMMAALLAVASGCGAAMAQDASTIHPPLTPTRDVQVDYNVQPDGVPEPKAVRTWFAYNGGLMRIDSPQGMGETILNRMSRQVTIIINTQKVYSQLDARYGIRNPFLLDLSMTFARKGSATVAGVACTQWDVTTDQGGATACVTEDGVVLQEIGVDGDGLRGRLEATKVVYGPIPDSMFQPPAGYRRIDPPPPPGAPRTAAPKATDPNGG